MSLILCPGARNYFWTASIIIAGCLAILTSCRWATIADLGKEDHITFTKTTAMAAMKKDFPRDRFHEGKKLHGKGLTVEECRQIALTNNLNFQTAKLDELIKASLSHGEWARMLPHAIVSAKFDEGDNIVYSDLMGDSYWANYYERSAWHFFLEGRWSPTDAALAYYSAKNADNRIVQSHYETVRVSQKIVESVEVSFFRLLSLQACLPEANRLVSIREQITKDMGDLLRDKLAAMVDYHKAKHAQNKARSILSQLTADAQRQRNLLLSTMGFLQDSAAGGSRFDIQGELREPHVIQIPADVELEALRNRPEAYRAGVKHFESVNDYKRSVVKNFPRVTLFWRYLDDRYNHPYDKNRQQAGILLYFDVVDWLTNFADSCAASRDTVKTEKEVSAIALAIGSQARMAVLKYLWLLEQVKIKGDSLADSCSLLEVAKRRASNDDLDKLAESEARAEMILEKIEWQRAVGESNAGFAELRSAMGTNLKPF